MSGGGSSGKNYYGFGKGKGGRKGDPIIWEGPLGPDSFPELAKPALQGLIRAGFWPWSTAMACVVHWRPWLGS